VFGAARQLDRVRPAEHQSHKPLSAGAFSVSAQALADPQKLPLITVAPIKEPQTALFRTKVAAQLISIYAQKIKQNGALVKALRTLVFFSHHIQSQSITAYRIRLQRMMHQSQPIAADYILLQRITVNYIPTAIRRNSP